jgi:hypothetical protein
MTDSIIFTVIASLVALGVVFTIHAIYRPKSLKIALLMIFLSISMPLALYKPFINSLGFAVFQGNASNEVFLHYTVDANQEWLYIWVIDTESQEPRAYKRPYTKEEEKKLNEAQQKGQEGVTQTVTIPPPPKGNSDVQYEVETQDLYNTAPGGKKNND